MELYDHLTASFRHQTLAVVLPYHTFDQWFLPWDSLSSQRTFGEVWRCFRLPHWRCYWHLGVKAVQSSPVAQSCPTLQPYGPQRAMSIGTTNRPTVVKTAPSNHGWHLTPVSAVGGGATYPALRTASVLHRPETSVIPSRIASWPRCYVILRIWGDFLWESDAGV